MISKLLKNILIFIFYVGLFSIFPVLFRLFPKVFVYYEVILDLWIINPIVSLVLSMIICFHDDFIFYLPVICGLAFLIVLLIFYDQSIFLFLIAYIILSLIGCFFGKQLYEKNRKEIF